MPIAAASAAVTAAVQMWMSMTVSLLLQLLAAPRNAALADRAMSHAMPGCSRMCCFLLTASIPPACSIYA